jgi:hypothetical protein
MSTKIMFKMTIDEAKEELVANERMQEAIAEKFNWPELTDKEYIAAELEKCNAEEVLLLNTIKLWEGIEKSREQIKKRQAEKTFFPSEKIDFTKDSEYTGLFGE